MRGSSQGGSNVRTRPRVVARVLVSSLALIVMDVRATAQETPRPTPTPHWITAPSLPVRGPRVRSTPIPPGAMVPTPGTAPPPEHMIGIHIDGFNFMMHPGPCARSVDNAIRAHRDLFTGDQACDGLIRQARAIQRQKEAEDPSYAKPPNDVVTNARSIRRRRKPLESTADGHRASAFAGVVVTQPGAQ